MEENKIKIYGIPVEDLQDVEQGISFQSDESNKLYGIVYCGFKTPFNEVFQPTNRLWYFSKDDVKNTGTLEGYSVNKNKVRYYDVDLKTKVMEKFYQEVQLVNEVSSNAIIFARKLAINPGSYVIDEPTKNTNPEELQSIVSQFIDSREYKPIPPPPPVPTPHPTLENTVRMTRVWPFFVFTDNLGGDTDYR